MSNEQEQVQAQEEAQAPSANQGLAPEVVEAAKAHIKSMREHFAYLNLKYTMASFEYCSRNNLDLDNLRMFVPKNHLDLLLLATPNLKPEEALALMGQWTAKGFSLPMLHVFALEAAKASGFFTKRQDLEAMFIMAQEDQDNLGLLLPLARELGL